MPLGSPVLLFSGCCAAIALALAVLYRKRRHAVAAGRYSPRLAWLRAGICFSLVGVLAASSGALEMVLGQPLVRPGQFDNPAWLALSLLALTVILVGYGLIWPRGTFTDGRRRHVPTLLLYGSLWGLSQGLLFLSLWLLVARLAPGPWSTALGGYLLIGAFQGLWHRYFWDIQVSPPHNYSEWNGRKVLLAHTPNLVVCLVHMALFGNAGLFVLLQALALLLSTWAMRFPPWWDDYSAVAGAERSLRSAGPA